MIYINDNLGKIKNMFLETLAKHILHEASDNLTDHCFVFPNRRSGLFFNRFLVKHATGTQWAPKTVTINELMQDLSGYVVADQLDILFTLYDIYLEVAPLPEQFDSFYPWGEMMINDFDNLDKYMVDPESIFRNIKELKEIDDVFGDLEKEEVEFIRKFWKSFHQGGSTREKDMFLTTWKMLPGLYRSLKKQLTEREEGYEGMLYRNVAEMDMVNLTEKLTSAHYSFIGFNALSQSEKRLFSKLRNKGMASFYWDYDERYIRDEFMEAGRFMRDNIVQFPPPVNLDIFNSLDNERDIRIFNLPSDVLQAKTVHQILSERTNTIVEANDTAIVACNENLLMPVLVSLPDQVNLVNITMGYPFSNTPLYSFTEGLLRLYRNTRKNRDGTIKFYNKDVLSVLNHQYYQLISNEDPSGVIRNIIHENRVYVDPDFFTGEFAGMIFRQVSTTSELCQWLDKLLLFILDRLQTEEQHQYRELEKEYVLVMLSRLNKLSQIIDGRPELELQTFIKLFKRIMSGQRIPFTGEPLAGLQVMGILETRLLDFDNVIMLSVNEDIMPRSSAGHSFIPYSFRYAYGLPTREDMDAIYAYYFYRIIQRAKKVDLLFKGAAEGVRSGEMSRYLYQMKYDYDAVMVRPVLSVHASDKSAISIDKSPEIISVLEKYMDGDEEGRYFSPSALNTYIECSLKFYFRKVTRIKEQEELLEELDAIGFGNILHHAIHELYEKISEGKEELTREDLISLKTGDQVDSTLEDVFAREFYKSGKKRIIEGSNLVIIAILKKYLLKIIDTDAGIAPISMLDLEKDYKVIRNIRTGQGIIPVLLGGKIDRIDRPHNGITRIIDYKTGGTEQVFQSIDSLFEKDALNRNKEAFQAFVYASLYLDKNPEQEVMPGLYIVRKMFGENYSPEFRMGEPNHKMPLQNFKEYYEKFNERLEILLEEIFNPDIPFTQTLNTAYCKYCDFNGICDRG